MWFGGGVETVRQWETGSTSSRIRLLGMGVALFALVACGGVEADVSRPPGEPLAGLTEDQLAQFYTGRELFDRWWTPETFCARAIRITK